MRGCEAGHARLNARLFRTLVADGAGEDLDPDMDGMSMRTFQQLADTADDETVVFSFIVFESREHRDPVNAWVMDDPGMDPENFEEEMPFDTERMSYGGFRSIVSYES